MMKATIEYPLTEEDAKEHQDTGSSARGNGLLRYIGKSLNDYF